MHSRNKFIKRQKISYHFLVGRYYGKGLISEISDTEQKRVQNAVKDLRWNFFVKRPNA